MSTHNLCFEQKYEKCQFLSENFHFLVIKFSEYMNRHVFMLVKSCDQELRDLGLHFPHIPCWQFTNIAACDKWSETICMKYHILFFGGER